MCTLSVLEMKEKCNIECFREFTQGLLSEKHQEQKLQCSRLALVAPNVMYSLACKLILSDLPEHRKDRPHNLRKCIAKQQLKSLH